MVIIGTWGSRWGPSRRGCEGVITEKVHQPTNVAHPIVFEYIRLSHER